MKPIHIVAAAEGDLKEIRDWSIERWGVSHWLKRASAIQVALDRIRDDHPVGQLRDDLSAGMRAVIVKPHIIFYREETDYLVVLRVVDGRRDLFSLEFFPP